MCSALTATLHPLPGCILIWLPPSLVMSVLPCSPHRHALRSETLTPCLHTLDTRCLVLQMLCRPGAWRTRDFQRTAEATLALAWLSLDWEKKKKPNMIRQDTKQKASQHYPLHPLYPLSGLKLWINLQWAAIKYKSTSCPTFIWTLTV